MDIKLIKHEADQLLIESYMYYFRYGIHVSIFADTRLTESKDYGIMTPSSDDIREISSNRGLIELYYNSDNNLKKFLLLYNIRRTRTGKNREKKFRNHMCIYYN